MNFHYYFTYVRFHLYANVSYFPVAKLIHVGGWIKIEHIEIFFLNGVPLREHALISLDKG